MQNIKRHEKKKKKEKIYRAVEGEIHILENCFIKYVSKTKMNILLMQIDIIAETIPRTKMRTEKLIFAV